MKSNIKILKIMELTAMNMKQEHINICIYDMYKELLSDP
jgi:hypothetical protein